MKTPPSNADLVHGQKLASFSAIPSEARLSFSPQSLLKNPKTQKALSALKQSPLLDMDGVHVYAKNGQIGSIAGSAAFPRILSPDSTALQTVSVSAWFGPL